MNEDTQDSLTCLDLFCGCGGFTLGMARAGFKVLAALDNNKEAVATLKKNSPKTLALRKDLTSFSPVKLAAKLGVNSVDVIVGGPPCQGFSTVRQVDSANHGPRVRRDKRRYLYRVFLEYVAAFRPRVFVMENVLGIQSAAKGKFFTRVQAEARDLGYRVQAQVEESWKLGVPQKRRRQLIIGVRNDIPGFFTGELGPAKRVSDQATPKLWDAIGDLPPLKAGEGLEETEYDVVSRQVHFEERGAVARQYLEKVCEVGKASKLTSHRARPHNDQDLRDFSRVHEGEHGGEAEARGEKMEFTYKRTCFKDRYKRQHRENYCSTVVAHLCKDGLGFIHPTQNRSLTPREAARIQSFPDWFFFPVARTHQFRLIGNAVPPLVAEAVGEEILAFLGAAVPIVQRINLSLSPLPATDEEAVDWLRPFLDSVPAALRCVSTVDFKKVWYSIAFLYSGLHPDAALDHGETIGRQPEELCGALGRDEHRLISPFYERSGWPVVLAPIAREAWRRYRCGELKEEEFYCAEAQMAGMSHRNIVQAQEVQKIS